MNALYLVAAGVGGAGVGFVCGYILAKNRIKDTNHDKMITYHTEMEYYKEKYYEEKRERKALEREIADVPFGETLKEETEEDAATREMYGQNNRVEYHKFSKIKPLDIPDHRPNAVNVKYHVDNPPSEGERVRPPYIITDEDFQVDFPYVTSSTISYYPGDGIFADERGERITDPVKIVGDEAIAKLKNCDDECIYVHNDEMHVNFCIVIEHGLGYMKDYLGYDDSEEE